MPVIIHLDLDAFYAQVEMLRLKLPKSTPVAVQQWNGLIATNYAARSKGVLRFLTIAEALEKCPDLQLVHVPTYAPGRNEPEHIPRPSQHTHKVSLDSYRRASRSIMTILQSRIDSFKLKIQTLKNAKSSVELERASIDEVFMEVSGEVLRRIVLRVGTEALNDEHLDRDTLAALGPWDLGNLPLSSCVDFTAVSASVSINESTNESTVDSINESTVDSINDPTVDSINESIVDSTVDSTNEPTAVIQSTLKSFADPTRKSCIAPTENPSVNHSTTDTYSSQIPISNPIETAPTNNILGFNKAFPYPKQPPPETPLDVTEVTVHPVNSFTPHSDFTPQSWAEVELYYGAVIAQELRQALKDELGFECSAGVASSKALAKLLSSNFKPNQQSLLLPRFVTPFLANIPVTKIRNLGGKAGEDVEKLFGTTCGEVWNVDREVMKSKGMEYVWSLVRGVDNDEVAAKPIQKSFMAAKSFRPALTKSSSLRTWLPILSSELYNRLLDDHELHSRWPKTLTIMFSEFTGEGGSTGDSRSASKSCPFLPKHRVSSPDAITNKCLELVKDIKFPLFRIAVQVSAFETGSGGMMKFVQKGVVDSEKTMLKSGIGSGTGTGTATGVSSAASMDNDKNAEFKRVLELSMLDSGPSQKSHDESTVDDEAATDFQWECPKCKVKLPFDQEPEHLDWHFARELIHEDRRVVQEARGSAPSSTSASDFGLPKGGRNSGSGSSSGTGLKRRRDKSDIGTAGTGLLRWFKKGD